MQQVIAKEILSAFSKYETDLPDYSPSEMVIEPVGGGLINHTYKVSSASKPPFLLQRINKNVFKNPVAVQENYIEIWQYATFEFTGLTIPEPKYCGRDITLFLDEEENYWRAFEFIEGTKSYPVASTIGQAKSTARTFAAFTAVFDDFNVGLLKTVIPGFHDLGLRYDQFEKALNGELYERISIAMPLITELKQRERYRHFYDIITESPKEFPLRVTHHDAKIANVLFSKKNGRVVCAVDLDTVMPGYFFSDLGDMIRSMVCSRDENSTEFDKLSIRKSYYDAILSGYLAGMKNLLTTSEKKYIHYAGLLMIYMQALRFVSDFLNGDKYYQIKYADQNFDRARNQLTLLQRLEEFLRVEYKVRL